MLLNFQLNLMRVMVAGVHARSTDFLKFMTLKNFKLIENGSCSVEPPLMSRIE